MPRGRKPKPAALKILDGSAKVNPGRVNQHEPEPSGSRPAMPAKMSPDAQRAWKDLVDWLDEMGLLTSTDEHAMRRYAEGWADYLALLREWRQTMFDDRCPVAARLKNVELQLNRLAAEFGLTPAARARLVAPGAGKSAPSKLQELLG